MFWLRKIFSFLIGQMASQYILGRAQRQATLFYLKTLQTVRRSLLAALLIFFTLQLMVLGFLGAAVTGIWLIPSADLETKLYLLLAFFGCLFLLPLGALLIFFSERTWYKASGAQKMMEDSTAA